MDPATHKRMRTAHLNHSQVCSCGRRMRGNGWMSHARHCRPYLLEHGYPLDDGTVSGLRESFTFEERVTIRRELGRMRADDLPSPVWGFSEIRQRLQQVYAATWPGRFAP